MRIKYLVMDVDGTLTDGKIYMGSSGELMKAFSIKDGGGINMILKPAGGIPVIITARKSLILENRCRELGIEMLFQGVADKVEKLKALAAEYGFNLSDVAYIGDDLNDLKCMKLVSEAGGLVGSPSDACKEVLALANYVSDKKGGDGAVRDFIEWLVESFK